MLAVGAQRNDLVLRLQGVDRPVVFVGTVGVGPSQDDHEAGSALDLCEPRRDRAVPTGTSDQVTRGLSARGAGARRVEVRHP